MKPAGFDGSAGNKEVISRIIFCKMQAGYSNYTSKTKNSKLRKKFFPNFQPLWIIFLYG